MKDEDKARAAAPAVRGDEARGWPWGAALTMALVSLVVVSIAGVWVAWSGDRTELEEHRALYYALSLSHLASDHGHGKAQTFLDALGQEEPGLVEGFVIGGGREDEFGISRGQGYVVALEPAMRGRDLGELVRAGGRRDKLRADRFAHVTSGVEASKRPGRASPEYVLEQDLVMSGQRLQAAQVAVASSDGSSRQARGAAGASLRPLVPPPPVPWWLVFGAALVSIGAVVGFERIGASDARSQALTAALGLLGLAVLAGSVWHYHAHLGAQLQAMALLPVHVEAAARAADLSGPEISALLQASDHSFTGASGHLFGGASGGWEQAIAARHGWGRSMVVVVSVLLVWLLVFGLRRTLVRLALALKTQPHAYAYVLPSLLGMALLVFVPFGFGVGMSLFDNDARRYYYVGLANFVELLSSSPSGDVSFYWTFFVTVLWTVSNVFLHAVIGLGLALILKEPLLRFKAVYRVLLIIPWAVPNYITALIWKGMFNKEFGAVNLFLEKIQLLVGLQPQSIDWLGGGFVTAFTANLVTNTWLGFPFMMVVSLGALQSIPASLYEAAEVDGASRWQQFTQITLPLLKPALFPAIILGSIWTFNMFNVIYLVSGGGPNNTTEILITDAYRAFDVLGRYGFAAAYSVLIFVVLFLYTVITNRVTRATEGAFE